MQAWLCRKRSLGWQGRAPRSSPRSERAESEAARRALALLSQYVGLSPPSDSSSSSDSGAFAGVDFAISNAAA